MLTREDPESPTGLHLEVRPEVAPWVNTVPAVLRGAIDDLPTLSGFGTHAGAVMRFTAPVAASEHMFTLYDLGETPPVTVPIELTLREEGATVIIQPLRPLRPATRHALFAAGLTDGDGGCVRPSPALRALLTDDALAPALEGMRARYHAALEATEVDPYTLNAATVFTTHGDLDVVAAAAADVTTRAYAWSAPPVCDDRGDYRRCDGEFEAYDYRDDRHIATAAPGEAWTLPVSVWLPASGPGPFPTLVYGHGLGGSRGEGRALARLYCPRGFAIIAIDAMRHGAHPTADPEDPLPALAFLGIDLQQVRIDALALRGHFNQSNLDRLQLIELVRDSPDVDGDGVADLDIDRLAYWGISLGGMLGSGLLALSDDLGAGILSVAGGGLLLFVTDTSSVANLRPAILRLFGGEDRFERMLPLAQTLVDAADPAAWGPYVTGPRLSGAQHRPDVLLPVAAEDDTVPPPPGRPPPPPPHAEERHLAGVAAEPLDDTVPRQQGDRDAHGSLAASRRCHAAASTATTGSFTCESGAPAATRAAR